jgi:protein ImuA
VAARSADEGVLGHEKNPSTASGGFPPSAGIPSNDSVRRSLEACSAHEIVGRMVVPHSPGPTLSELFAAHSRDGGWAGFLLAQIDRAKPVLWVQERMAILESGRVHPPGLPLQDLIHVETRDARDALWAMEEGLRCAGLSAVIGELWGDPKRLDFTATRRLAVAAERSGVPCWLVRIGGTANLSGARMRWRIASAPSLAHPFDPRAPGAAAWDAELFRARGFAPGWWRIAHDRAANRFDLVASPGDRALGEDQQLSA